MGRGLPTYTPSWPGQYGHLCNGYVSSLLLQFLLHVQHEEKEWVSLLLLAHDFDTIKLFFDLWHVPKVGGAVGVTVLKWRPTRCYIF